MSGPRHDDRPTPAALKRTVRALAAVAVLGRVAVYTLTRVLLGRPRAFAAAVQAAARWPGLWGVYRRGALLRWLGVRAAVDSHIEFGTLFSRPTAVIGPGAYVGAYCCLGDVRIGAKTMLGDGVCVPSGRWQHGTDRTDVPMADQPGRLETVTLGANCWIGSRAVVLADVGDGAVVAAAAVVTHPVPPGTVVAGTPARAIGPAAARPGREAPAETTTDADAKAEAGPLGELAWRSVS